MESAIRIALETFPTSSHRANLEVKGMIDRFNFLKLGYIDGNRPQQDNHCVEAVISTARYVHSARGVPVPVPAPVPVTKSD